jgi:tetratricopeptide (TPR) repeat protein
MPALRPIRRRLSCVVAALVAAVLAAGCPRPRTPAAAGTAAEPPAHPGADLASAGVGAVGTGGDSDDEDPRLETSAPKVVDLDVIHLDVVGRDAAGEPVIESSTPGPLLARGNHAFTAGKLDEAARWYRDLVAAFPESSLAPVALYNLALVHERKGERAAALQAYVDLYGGYPASPEAIEGMLRAAALRADREEWTEAERLLLTVEARDDLRREIRIEVEARLGYVLYEQDRLDDAEAALEDAIKAWRRATRIDDPYYIAMAHFYLGEADARRFARLPVRSADRDLPDDMRAKRELLLRAYGHWKEALELKHAYWATAAGYQMSQIFYDYWLAAVRAPYPDGMTAQARPLYVREVHDRVRVNLEKALDGHRAVVELAEAYGVETTWSEASRDRAVEIMKVLDREARGELVVP